MVPAMKFYLDTFKIQPLTVWELFQCNVKQAGTKAKMAEWWTSTKSLTKTGRPIDGLICPVHASAAFPHDFPSWWGYTSFWNILDYPAVTIPVKNFKISPEADPKDAHYKPLDNPFDKITYDMCKFHILSISSFILTSCQMTRSCLLRSQCVCKSWDGHSRMRSYSLLHRF